MEEKERFGVVEAIPVDRSREAFSGDVSEEGPGEVLRQLAESGRTGVLTAESELRHAAEIHLEGGQIVLARMGPLRGEEAAVAFLGLRSGEYRFVPGRPLERGEEPETPLSPEAVERKRQWLEDELARRHRYLPGPTAPITLCSTESADLQGPLASLPAEGVLSVLRYQGSATLEGLIRETIAAPLSVAVSVACLVEQGKLGVAEGEAEDLALELEGEQRSRYLDGVVRHLLRDAAAPVHVLLVTTSAQWKSLLRLLESSESDSREIQERLVELRARRGGSLRLVGDGRLLLLHLQCLTEKNLSKTETVLALCKYVILWSGQGEVEQGMRSLVASAEENSRLETGLLVASSQETQSPCRELAAGRSRWRVSSEPPAALGALLELLL